MHILLARLGEYRSNRDLLGQKNDLAIAIRFGESDKKPDIPKVTFCTFFFIFEKLVSNL